MYFIIHHIHVSIHLSMFNQGSGPHADVGRYNTADDENFVQVLIIINY